MRTQKGQSIISVYERLVRSHNVHGVYPRWYVGVFRSFKAEKEGAADMC